MATKLKGAEAVETFRNDANGQVVLVLQGGGALGAYQVGVYQALHEAGVEPDWVIGTSIGAINASLIAGNRRRALDALREFWAVFKAIAHGTISRRGRELATRCHTGRHCAAA